MQTTTRIMIGFSTFLLAAASGAHAVDAPGTPPPETGIVTPLTGDRDSSPSFPSASPASDTGCAGETTGETPFAGKAAVPTMINGAVVSPGTIRSAADWCAGAYDPEAGTNFADH